MSGSVSVNVGKTILALDTATNACSVALKAGGGMYSRHEVVPQQHAKLILPMIQALLSEANIALSDLDAIAFGCGPGSFMGVRLATATAQGLAFGLSIPLIPVSTLQTLAQGIAEEIPLFPKAMILPAWDARMDEMYWGAYTCDYNGIMKPVIDDTLCTPSAIDVSLISTVPFTLVGNAWSVYAKALPHEILSKASAIHDELYPDAKAMLTIATSKYLQNEIVSPENAHPHYVRHHVVHNHN